MPTTRSVPSVRSWSRAVRGIDPEPSRHRHRIERLEALPTSLKVAAVVLVMAVCWTVVYTAGGSRTALSHLFYVPVVLAALPFGIVGGVIAALAAAVLAGAAMPLDVAGGQAQELVTWMTRGGFFVFVGALSGAGSRSLWRGSPDAPDAPVDRRRPEVELAVVEQPGPDPLWRQRVGEVIDDRDFVSMFQPIYALDGGRLLAVEALTRFGRGPRWGPAVWFAEAHRAGLGVELELATLAAALRLDAVDEAVAVTFNASPQLLLDPRLAGLLEQHAGRELVVEVTEHTIIDDYRQIAESLARLRRRGLRVAVDDAGAGFASLRHIVRLEPDLIKLHPSLTQDLRHDPVRRPLADALIQFADRIGSGIVVEGIETVADLTTWQQLGARAAQGNVLGRPGHPPFPGVHALLIERSTVVPRPVAGWRGEAASEGPTRSLG
jgi:EAL domain-containing protein (putative c-di-GMP-specific phosphodiesterase class I)